jgi:hypothetical protein
MNLWTFVNGSQSPNQPAVLTGNSAAIGNQPGAKRNVAFGYAKYESLWLFGGTAFHSTSTNNKESGDLWRADNDPPYRIYGSVTASSLSFCTNGSSELNSNSSNGTTFQWYKNNIPVGGANQATYSATESGTYGVVIGNVYGCSEPKNTIDIVEVPAPAAPSATVTSQPSCAVSTGKVSVTGYDNTLTYRLVPTTTGTTYTADGSGVFNGVVPGTYNVTATNGSNCTTTSSGTVTVNPVPSAPAAPSATVTSQPSCAVSTGKVSVTGYDNTLTYRLVPTTTGTTYTADGSGVFKPVNTK